MGFKIKNDAKVMLTALIAGGTLGSTIVSPATIEASEMSSIDYSSIVKDDLDLEYKKLPIDTSVNDVELVVSREGPEEGTIEELGLVLLSDNTTILSTFKDEERTEVNIDDNVILNITGKVVYKNKVYYRAELSQSIAANIVDNYLDIKNEFSAEGQENYNLDYKVLEIDTEDEEEDIEITEAVVDDSTDNNNFVFFLDGNEVSKEMHFDNTETTMYALQDTEILSLDDLESTIGKVEEAESIEIVGENNKWFLVEVEKEGVEEGVAKGIVEKRKFSDKEIFVPDFTRLVANKKTILYTDIENETESGYHVEEGGIITQLDRSENWTRLELDTGEELFAKTEDFNESGYTIYDIDESEFESDYENDEDEDYDEYEIDRDRDRDREDVSTTYIDEDLTTKEPTIIKRKVRKVKKVIPKEEIEYKKAQGEAIGQQIADFGLQFVGGRYVWGGNSLETGVDCSGFVREVYKRFGVDLPRHSSQQGQVGRSVSIQEALPGDIVAYDGHVGLYIGNNKMVHASNPKRGIIVTDIGFSGTYNSIRRVIDN